VEERVDVPVNVVRHTFTPSLPRLTGVEVQPVVANPGPASADVTLMVMNTKGIALAVVSKTVPIADCRHVLFVFPRGGLPVSLGQVYGIGLSSVGSPFGWKYVVGGYANGAALFQWQTCFTRYPQHFPVPQVRCELNNLRTGRL
jgi:hypothetical protein